MLRAIVCLMAFGSGAACQTANEMKSILDRLDLLERENRELRIKVADLEKKVTPVETALDPGPPMNETLQVQQQRIADLAQTKVEASQKMPLSVTGMLLFNAFNNGTRSNVSQDPVVAATTSGPASAGASLRQTILGLKFDGPSLPGGGTVTGSIYFDFFAGSRDPGNHLLHIRTATLDLAWKNTTLSIGQDKPIFAPRDPDSLAMVAISPLTAAGNLWDWQPQVRLEQRFAFGDHAGLRAQFGVYQTLESAATVPAAFSRTQEDRRPAYQGRFNLWREDGDRRFEIAPGFHAAASHVAGTSVPSRLFSLDWLARPVKAFEFTGAFYQGQNVANMGALRQGYTILQTGLAIPVHSTGLWAQTAFFVTPKLTAHLYGGQERDREADLFGSGIKRNFIYAGNLIYRLAPNVLASFEASQVRTFYLVGGLRLNNHYDLALAYLF